MCKDGKLMTDKLKQGGDAGPKSSGRFRELELHVLRAFSAWRPIGQFGGYSTCGFYQWQTCKHRLPCSIHQPKKHSLQQSLWVTDAQQQRRIPFQPSEFVWT